MVESIHTYTTKPSHNDKKIIIEIMNYAIDIGLKLYAPSNKKEYKNILFPLFDAVTHKVDNKGGYTIELDKEEYHTIKDHVLFFKTINAETLVDGEVTYVKHKLYMNSPMYQATGKSVMFLFFSLSSIMSFDECKNLTSIAIPESSGMWRYKNKDEFIDNYIDRAVEKHGSAIYLDMEESDTELRRLSEIFWFIDFLKGIYKYKDDLQEITDYVNARQRNV